MIERLQALARLNLVRNVLALYGVRLVNQFLPLLVIPYLARVLAPEGWGLVAFAQAFAMYGVVLVEYGFELSGTRAVARDRTAGEPLAELLAGVLGTQAFLACLAAIAAVIVQFTVPALRDQPLLLIGGLAFAVFQGFYPIWYFLGQERVPLIAAIDVGAKILGTIAIFLLVDAPEDGWRVLMIYAAVALVSTGIAYRLLLRELRPTGMSLALLDKTLRLGFSMFLMRMAVLMHTAGNAFLLGLLAAPQHVAFFAAGEKLCRPAAWLLAPINTALLPRLSHLVGADPARAHQLAGISLMVVGLLGIALGAMIALAAPLLVRLLFGPGYESAVPVLQLLSCIIPLTVINAALVSQWLIPHGLDRGLNTVILSATVFNVGLALLFVPEHKAFGMAAITVGIELYILAGLLLILRRAGLKPIAPRVLLTLPALLQATLARRRPDGAPPVGQG